MGCDIHIHTERRVDGNWEQVFDPFAVDEPRGYNTFAMLAGVRNGRGFAGSFTGDGFNPISEPRGLPEDITDETKENREMWDIDGHSDSWHNLKHLTEYDLTQKTKVLKDGSYPIRMTQQEIDSSVIEVTYAECTDFFEDAISKMERLSQDGIGEDVRIVFWFDN